MLEPLQVALFTFTEKVLLGKLVTVSNKGIGSQPSVPFVKVNGLISEPSPKTGVVITFDQLTRFPELFTPEFSIVPYS